jgi:tight adherence protein B
MHEGYNGTVLLLILGMGGLAAFLAGTALFAALRSRAEKAALQRRTPSSRGTRVRWMAAAAVLAMLPALRGGAGAALAALVVGGAAGWYLPGLIDRFRAKRRRGVREKQIPAALDLLANGMRSGMSFLQAWSFASQQTPDPFGGEMSETAREIQLGRPMEEALENLRRRVDCEDMDLTVAAIRLTLATGGDLPKGLATIAGTIRDRAQMRGKIDSLTAQGRLQAVLVAGIPLIMIFVTYAVDPVRTSLLWTTTYGWILMGILGVMDVIGFFAIQWVCAIKI